MVSIRQPKLRNNMRALAARFVLVVVGIWFLSPIGGTNPLCATACRPLSDKPLSQIITSVHASLSTGGFIVIDFELASSHEFLDEEPCTGDPDGPGVRTNVSSNLCGVNSLSYSHTNCDFFGPHAFIEVAPCSLTQDLVVGWSLRYEQRYCNLGVNPRRKKGTVTISVNQMQGGTHNITSTLHDDPVPE